MYLPTGPVLHGKPLDLLPAGRYKLTAKVSMRGPTERETFWVTSPDDATLEILPPQENEAAAVALLRDPDMAGFFEGRRGGCPPPVKRLLAEHPTSVYIPYVKARLIMDGLRSAPKSTETTSAPSSQASEPGAVIRKALAFAQEYPRMPFTDNILFECARIQPLVGRIEDRRLTLERIVRDFPDSDAREAAEYELLPPERQATRPH